MAASGSCPAAAVADRPIIVPPVVGDTVRAALVERDRRQGLAGMTRQAALVAAELAAAPVTTPDVVRSVARWHQDNPDATQADGRSTLLAGVWGGRAGRDWALSIAAVIAAAGEPDQTGPVAAGIAVVAGDTGRVLMLQRCLADDDPHGGKWEFPGGKLDDGEGVYEAAQREFSEEARIPVPGRLAGSWTSADGVYQGFIHVVDREADVTLNVDHEDRHVTNPDDPDGDNVEVVAWWSPDDAEGNPVLRREVLEQTPWDQLREPPAVAAALAQVAAIAEPLDIIREIPGQKRKPKRDPLERVNRKLQRVDDDLRRQLRAGAEVAMADGLRRAGVKVTQRAAKRSKAVQASVADCDGVYPAALLAAAGVTEQEALAHAFDSFRARADRWIDQANRRKLEILQRELGIDASAAERARRRWDVAKAVAVGFLVGGLARLAFRRLTGEHPLDDSGEDPGGGVLVPGGLVHDAIAVADGKPYSGDALAGDAVVDKWAPGVTLEVISDSGVTVGVIVGGDAPRLVEKITWRWNDSEHPFGPHLDLDGTEATADTISSVWAKDADVFPYNTTYWFPGDHHGCLCSWDSSFVVADSPAGGDAVAASAGVVIDRSTEPRTADARKGRDADGDGIYNEDGNTGPQQQGSDDPSYRGQHQPPGPDDEGTPTIDDLTRPGSWMEGNDVYEHPEYFGHGDPVVDREAARALAAARGKPNAMVKIYRAAPKEAGGINPGDWVTTSKTYAKGHAAQSEDPAEDWPIYEAEVPANVIYNGGNDIIEWGYWGDEPIKVEGRQASAMPPARTADGRAGRDGDSDGKLNEKGDAKPRVYVDIADDELSDAAYSKLASRQMFQRQPGDQPRQLRATRGNGDKAGTLTYAVQPDKRLVRVVEIETAAKQRRQGVASQMMDELKAKYPDHDIEYGEFSPAGKQWHDAYERRSTPTSG